MWKGDNGQMQRLETQLTDTEITRLDELLASIHAPLQPMDASAVDGYLCGALLQPVTILWPEVLPALFDADARQTVPAGVPAAVVAEVSALAERRFAELAQAIGARQWFDPWIFDFVDEDETDTGDGVEEVVDTALGLASGDKAEDEHDDGDNGAAEGVDLDAENFEPRVAGRRTTLGTAGAAAAPTFCSRKLRQIGRAHG
jgi:uncharacterized protein